MAGEQVDASAGMIVHKKLGDAVSEGDLLLTLFTERSETVLYACKTRAAKAVHIGPDPVTPPALISHVIDIDSGVQPWTL